MMMRGTHLLNFRVHNQKYEDLQWIDGKRFINLTGSFPLEFPLDSPLDFTSDGHSYSSVQSHL